MKSNLILLTILLSTSALFAGGLVTNTNQSAAFARTLTRHATLGIDGVYYNPAGLSLLNNGFHFSLSNQSIFQTRTITSDYPFFSNVPESYEAELTAPLFPSIYAAYKMDKWTFSFGFNVIGGGGSADFKTGLPSFEIPVASLVPMLQGGILGPLDQAILEGTGFNPGLSNLTGYDMSMSFNGSSTYFGYQVGATYAINEMISVAFGGRYVTAKNTYEGSLTDILIGAPEMYGGYQTAGDYLRFAAGVPGLPAEVVAVLNGTATALDGQTADAGLKTTQTGSGFTPIIGLNIHLSDMVNLAVKYEHQTKIELTNDTEVDDVGLFPDGEKTRADLPGMFSVGAELKPLNKLTAAVGFNYFLDKSAYYGSVNESNEQINSESTIDENAWSLAASLEYKFLGLLGVSAGFSTGNLGVNDTYQSDLSYALKSTSVAGGVFVDVGETITINAGFTYVMYDDYSHSQSYLPTGFPAAVPYTVTYMKNTMLFAIGVDFSF